jgi:hypothetical protein
MSVEAEMIEGGVAIATEKVKKPVKTHSVLVDVWDDGTLSPLFVEFANIGRRKNQKIIHQSAESFLKSIKAELPQAHDELEQFVETIEPEMGIEDAEECNKIGLMELTVWSDGGIEKEFQEIVRGTGRGAPKKWRQEFPDFQHAMGQQIGTAVTDVTKLLQ